MWAYSAALAVGLVLSAPWWLLRMATTARYREGLGQRLGRVPAGLRAAVAGRRVVWVHAVSVGEVLAVAPLVRELEAALNRGHGFRGGSLDPWMVVVSTTTRTGQAVAQERFGASRVFYLPFDFRWAVQAFRRALRPALLLLAESELWPRLLHEFAASGVPVAVVNARVSDHSFRRARRWRRWWKPVLGKVSLFLAQSEPDAERLRALGASPAAVRVSGNLKFDLRERAPGAVAERLRSLLAGRPVVVAGSTAADEDEPVLGAFARVLETVPEAVLVLAPRHPEHFGQALAAAGRLGTVRASMLLSTEAGQPPAVVLLDTVGDLAEVYGMATVAFVGGSLRPHGGHNPLEPARFAVPVVMGRFVENFRVIADVLEAAGGLRRVCDTEELASYLLELLTSPEKAHSLGKRGQNVFLEHGGATGRSIQHLMPLLGISHSDLQSAPGSAAGVFA